MLLKIWSFNKAITVQSCEVIFSASFCNEIEGTSYFKCRELKVQGFSGFMKIPITIKCHVIHKNNGTKKYDI